MGTEAVRDGGGRWLRPRVAADVDVAFPASVTGYLPPLAEIPEEFQQHPGTKWNRLASELFFRGGALPPTKDGIDRRAALRHLQLCLGSFEPKHEHKEAGVAYLLSLWCEDTNNPQPPKAAV